MLSVKEYGARSIERVAPAMRLASSASSLSSGEKCTSCATTAETQSAGSSRPTICISGFYHLPARRSRSLYLAGRPTWGTQIGYAEGYAARDLFYLID